MECLAILNDLIIGAFGSILASAIIVKVLSVYEFNFKSKIVRRLDLLLNYAWMIRNRYSYEEDYPFTVHCAEEIIKLTIEIADHIKPLNLCRNKTEKRIFFTLLYDLQRRCERICFQTVGYDGRDEITTRIERINREQFINGEPNFIPEIEIEWMKTIIEGVSPQYMDGIIECNSYRLEGDKIFIKKDGITQSEFQRMVKAHHE